MSVAKLAHRVNPQRFQRRKLCVFTIVTRQLQAKPPDFIDERLNSILEDTSRKN
jgi:hypothetical protein